MKLGKTKIIFSVFCLIAALVLAVFTVYAWFVIPEDVRAGGIDSNVTTGDVIKFDVTVYYLDNKLSNDGKNTLEGYNKAIYLGNSGNVSTALTQYIVDDGEDGVLETDEDFMRPYGALGGKFATAVLIEIDLEIRLNANYYRIYASNTSETIDVTEPSGNDNIFTSSLSNVVAFNKAEGSDFNADKHSGLFKKTATIGSFYDSKDNKILSMVLQNNIHPSVQKGETQNYNEKLYFIMDYIDEAFPRLSSKMLEAGGTLDSRLSFIGDITIGLEIYDPNNLPSTHIN